MSEARFETVLQELRASAPTAPERLRERVGALPAAQPRRTIRLRPALAAAIGIAIAVGLGAAIIGGATGPSERAANHGDFVGSKRLETVRAQSATGGDQAEPKEAFAPTLTAKSRLQRQDITMSLRVRDLSRATQTAVRQTRRLGGYVAAADYSTEPNAGDSRLALRVPVQNVQKAIARFTELGTILSQHISVADLQGRVDRLDTGIAALEKRMGKLDGIRLDQARRALRKLERRRAALVQEGTYADISLQLTTRKAAAKHESPGRFDRFWGDAGDILGKELIAVLYVLVVAGPFAILAALALLAERARRRRADHRLLEETG